MSRLERGWNFWANRINPEIQRRLDLTEEPWDIVDAEGPWLIDSRNHRYFDATSGFGTQPLGYREPRLTEALKTSLFEPSPNYTPVGPNAWAGELAEALANICQIENAKVIFASGGAEAIDAAMKLARAATSRSRILSLEGAWHGCTYGAVSAMHPGLFQEPFAPVVPDIVSMPFDQPEAFLDRIDDQVAAILIEPIQMEGGIRAWSTETFSKLHQKCQEVGALWISDEIAVGLGRAGTWSVCGGPQAADIVVFGKGLGGGVLPVSAAICKGDIWNQAFGSLLRSEIHASTWGGQTWAAKAGLATLQALDPWIPAPVELLKAWQDICLRWASHPRVIAVPSFGWLAGIRLAPIHGWTSFDALGLPELAGRPSEGWLFTRFLKSSGIWSSVCAHDWSVVRCMPPINSTLEQLRFLEAGVLDALDRLEALA